MSAIKSVCQQSSVRFRLMLQVRPVTTFLLNIFLRYQFEVFFFFFFQIQIQIQFQIYKYLSSVKHSGAKNLNNIRTLAMEKSHSLDVFASFIIYVRVIFPACVNHAALFFFLNVFNCKIRNCRYNSVGSVYCISIFFSFLCISIMTICMHIIGLRVKREALKKKIDRGKTFGKTCEYF